MGTPALRCGITVTVVPVVLFLGSTRKVTWARFGDAKKEGLHSMEEIFMVEADEKALGSRVLPGPGGRSRRHGVSTQAHSSKLTALGHGGVFSLPKTV